MDDLKGEYNVNFVLTILLENKKTGKYEKILEKKSYSISACAQLSDMILSSANTKENNIYFIIKAEEQRN